MKPRSMTAMNLPAPARGHPSGISCRFFNTHLFYCCIHHVFCMGRPVFYGGFGISPCVRELHEPDPVSWESRKRKRR